MESLPHEHFCCCISLARCPHSVPDGFRRCPRNSSPLAMIPIVIIFAQAVHPRRIGRKPFRSCPYHFLFPFLAMDWCGSSGVDVLERTVIARLSAIVEDCSV